MTIDKFDGEYFFLSNYYPCPIEFDGRHWATSEHAFQAMKTANWTEQEMIRKEPTPGGAKRMGKKVLMMEEWDDIKYNVMKIILYIKFSNTEMKEKLLATGDEELIEGNTWGDTTWGVCNGVGTNWLGHILMEIRSLLKELK